MQLHFKESGQGRAVVLLHGLFGSADNWQPIAQRLAEKFHIFALDHRNHGQSPHSAEMNYLLMAGDVDRFMAARGLETAAVVGHSMGGKTAMQFALQFPERVEKLVVADMAPRAYAPAHDKIFAALLALDLPSFQTRQQIEDALAPEIPNLVLRRFLLKNLGRNADGKFFWKMNLGGLAQNYLRLGEPVAYRLVPGDNAVRLGHPWRGDRGSGDPRYRRRPRSPVTQVRGAAATCPATECVRSGHP